MLVQGQSVSGFTSFYLPILIYQGSKNLKYLNIIVGILVKSDHTEGDCFLQMLPSALPSTSLSTIKINPNNSGNVLACSAGQPTQMSLSC